VAQIYISSTFQDLQEHRGAVAAALEKLGHRVVAMERYVASDQRPLARCLKDVEAADVYVGIFAWRYGFVPKGRKKSITELELEHAEATGVPRLVFVLDENAPWLPGRIDSVTGENDRGARVAALRRRLGQELLVSSFQNVDQLATLASVAVTLQLASRQSASIAPETVDAVMVNESGMSSILDALTAAELMKVDLGDGTAWWSTRLYVLAALVAEHTTVREMIFVEGGNRYLGMAPPWKVRDRLADSFPMLNEAYQQARAALGRASPLSVLSRYMLEVVGRAPDRDESRLKEEVRRLSLAAWLGPALRTETLPDRQKRESDRDFAIRINGFPLAFVPVVNANEGALVQVVDRCSQAARIAAAALEHLP
jgi:hypothetical protein